MNHIKFSSSDGQLYRDNKAGNLKIDFDGEGNIAIFPKNDGEINLSRQGAYQLFENWIIEMKTTMLPSDKERLIDLLTIK